MQYCNFLYCFPYSYRPSIFVIEKVVILIFASFFAQVLCFGSWPLSVLLLIGIIITQPLLMMLNKSYLIFYNKTIARHFVQYSLCLSTPLPFYSIQTINSFLISRISANHEILEPLNVPLVIVESTFVKLKKSL